MKRVNTDYQIGLDAFILNPGFYNSDHSSFWDYGYGAIFLSEDFFLDPNPYYHTTRDSANKLNRSYFAKCSRFALATIATFGLETNLDSLGISNYPENYVLYQNFPNPFNSSTTIRFTIKRQRKVSITIYNILGQEIATVLEEEKPPGTYEVSLQMSSLARGSVPSGVYFCRLEIEENYREFINPPRSLTKKIVYLK